jgi:hypothetical protein
MPSGSNTLPDAVPPESKRTDVGVVPPLDTTMAVEPVNDVSSVHGGDAVTRFTSQGTFVNVKVPSGPDMLEGQK